MVVVAIGVEKEKEFEEPLKECERFGVRFGKTNN